MAQSRLKHFGDSKLLYKRNSLLRFDKQYHPLPTANHYLHGDTAQSRLSKSSAMETSKAYGAFNFLTPNSIQEKKITNILRKFNIFNQRIVFTVKIQGGKITKHCYFGLL